MQYALIKKTGKKIPLELKGRGKPYQILHKQTGTDGYSAFLLESQGNFNNIFAKLSQARYDIEGFWAELFKNVIREGEKGINDNGELDIVYVFNPETNNEKEVRIHAPPQGFYVPTGKFDGNNVAKILFQEDTLIPHKTIPFENRDKAVKLWKKVDLPIKYLSGFWRPDSYKNDSRILGRVFYPDFRNNGRFSVYATGVPSDCGKVWVASRPKILDAEDNECVMKI